MNLQAEPLHLKEATVTCIPRLRGGGGRSRRRGGSSAASPTQVSVLDRVRDVVLRLAMLPAATKGGATLRRMAISRAEARVVSPAASAAPPYADSYRSEAVDDCIEFLKQSAAGRASSAAAVGEESTATGPPSSHHVIEP
jgi:hypothetical protein